MAYKKIVLPRAVRETKEAIKWYQSRSDQATADFKTTLAKALTSIKKDPQKAPQKDGFHYLVMKTFPYIIFYKIDTDTKTVFILSVFNTHQDTTKYPQ